MKPLVWSALLAGGLRSLEARAMLPPICKPKPNGGYKPKKPKY